MGEDINEWVAFNTVDFVNQITMLVGTLADYCRYKEKKLPNKEQLLTEKRDGRLILLHLLIVMSTNQNNRLYLDQ